MVTTLHLSDQDRYALLARIIVAVKLNEGKFDSKQVSDFINNELEYPMWDVLITELLPTVAVKENNKWLSLSNCTSTVLSSSGQYKFLLQYLEPEELVTTSMNNAFANMDISTIANKISKLNMSKVKYFDGCFHNCKSSNMIDLSNWDMSAAEKIGIMFEECKYGQISFNFGKFNWKNVDYTFGAFREFGAESNLNEVAPYFFMNNTKSVNMSYMFYACTQIYDANLSAWKIKLFDTSSVFGGSTFYGKIPEGSTFDAILDREDKKWDYGNREWYHHTKKDEIIEHYIRSGVPLEIISKLFPDLTINEIRKFASEVALGIRKID